MTAKTLSGVKGAMVAKGAVRRQPRRQQQKKPRLAGAADDRADQAGDRRRRKCHLVGGDAGGRQPRRSRPQQVLEPRLQGVKSHFAPEGRARFGAETYSVIEYSQ
jgi:hypothetical protein